MCDRLVPQLIVHVALSVRIGFYWASCINNQLRLASTSHFILCADHLRQSVWNECANGTKCWKSTLNLETSQHASPQTIVLCKYWNWRHWCIKSTTTRPTWSLVANPLVWSAKQGLILQRTIIRGFVLVNSDIIGSIVSLLHYRQPTHISCSTSDPNLLPFRRLALSLRLKWKPTARSR